MIEIVDDDVVINNYDNSDLEKLSDADIVPPRTTRIHRNEVERINKSLREFQSRKIEIENSQCDLGDIIPEPEILHQPEQLDPDSTPLFDLREVAAAARMTYGEYKEMVRRNNEILHNLASLGGLF